MRNYQSKPAAQHPNDEKCTHGGRLTLHPKHGDSEQVAQGDVVKEPLAAMDSSQECTGPDPAAHHDHVLIEAILSFLHKAHLLLPQGGEFSNVLCAHVTSCRELVQTPSKAALLELTQWSRRHIFWQPVQGSDLFDEFRLPCSGLRFCGFRVALLQVLRLLCGSHLLLFSGSEVGRSQRAFQVVLGPAIII